MFNSLAGGYPWGCAASDVGTRHLVLSLEGAAVRIGSIGGVIVLVWLIIGVIAGGQRGYYKGSTETCAKAGTIAVTIIAGPLNYMGANPKVDCELPQPSQ